MADKKKYILVVNPISGDVDKSEILIQTMAYADKFKVKIILYETTGNQDEAAIKKLFLLYQPERIVIAGGDGTIKMVGEALEKQDVIFGILPAGSSNGLAVDLNLPTSIEENLPIAFHNHYMELDRKSVV